jgi:nitrilase
MDPGFLIDIQPDEEDGMTQGVVKAAVVQAGSVLFDTARTLAKLQVLVQEAASRGAGLAVFPEAFLGGYPKGVDFGIRVGSRTPEGREWFRRYFDSAITVPGPETEAMGEIARAAGMDLVVGVIEREGSTLYCSAVFIGRDGRLLGRHRKVVPTAAERFLWGSGDGSTLPVVQTASGRLGAVICWENYMPLLRMALYAQDLQIYCAPTVDDRETWLPTIRHIAMEGRCFVLSSHQFLRRSDCPPDYEPIQGNDPETVLIRGGSAIVDPFGNVLAGPCFGEETLLLADLDLRQIPRARFDLDVVGHYARPDVFQLKINRDRLRTVEDRVD